jgi:hypothetical protein
MVRDDQPSTGRSNANLRTEVTTSAFRTELVVVLELHVADRGKEFPAGQDSTAQTTVAASQLSAAVASTEFATALTAQLLRRGSTLALVPVMETLPMGETAPVDDAAPLPASAHSAGGLSSASAILSPSTLVWCVLVVMALCASLIARRYKHLAGAESNGK